MNAAQPLAGITIIELGTSVAAPYAGLILGEMGAEVIKIENPDGGDAARTWAIFSGKTKGSSLVFDTFNRNKKSVTVDLTQAGERDRLRRLILERADVVLQNLRPGVVDDMGIGADALLAEKPSLVYCNVGAFGDQGPMSRLPGYDPLMQAFTGLCHITGPSDGGPCRVGVPINDMGTGMWAAMGIVTKLLARKDTGKGGIVDVSLYETAMSWMTMPMASVLANGKSPGRYGMRGPAGLAPNRDFHASDGDILITVGTNQQFRNLCKALGHSEWAGEERFATSATRSRNDKDLSALLNQVFATRSRAEWMQVLNDAGVPNAPVHDPVEAMNHPQVKASGIVQGATDGASPQVLLPLKFDHSRPAYRHRAPNLGEHNDLLK